MTVSSFGYLVKDGTKNIWGNRLMSFASVAVLATCLLLVGFAMLVTININNMVSYVEQQNEAVVFVKDDASDAQIQELKTKLEVNDNVAEIVFVSKAEAFERQKATLGDDAGLFDNLGDTDFLPASFEIRIKDLSRLSETIENISSYENVQKVNASLELGEALTSAKNLINGLGGGIVVALIVVSTVIIANTIRASVFARRREINIMKYVGATDNFIRLPFIVEGLVLGFLAALIAYLIIWFLYSNGISMITSSSDTWLSAMLDYIVPFNKVAMPLGVAFAVGGMFTGAFGSLVSIRNHLKV